MHLIKFAAAVAVVGSSSAMLQGAQAVTRNGPGSCGEYEYWHDGKCVDARQKRPSTWSDGMTRRPVW
jgi:hypothetical protein